MFRKLRVKFIAITMAMVAIVMALAFTVVCLIEYQRSYSVVQTALDNAVQQAADETFRMHDRTGLQPGGQQDGLFSNEPGGPQGDQPSSQPSEQLGSLPSDQPGSQPSSQPSSKPSAQPGGQGEGQSGTTPNAAESASSSSPPSQSGSSSESAPEDANATAVEESAEGAAESGSSEIGAEGQAGSTASGAETGSDETDRPAPPSIGNRPGQQRATTSIVPVAVYRVDSNDELRVVPAITTASISSDVLADAAESIEETSDGFGTLTNMGLHYCKARKGGTTFFAFADTSYTDGWKSLALMLVVVGLGTLVVFFVISLFYSRWALRPVRDAWDSQKQFVADASHDLKTPLTVILANASILLKHPDHTIASESQWVESTQKEAEQMQGLVNEMLELAQVEAGEQLEPVRERIDLSDLVDGETLLFDSVALERGYAFECTVEQGISMLGDEKQVKKMVSTLIENAFKYVDDGGTVDIALRRAGKNATLAVRNTGSTISEEDLPHIFDRFYRTDKARTSGAGGFGLGLAIARGIAQRHGGDITCTSSEAEGTTFTVELPVNEREA